VSTSCDQKVKSCNDDIKTGNTSGNSSSGIDAVSDNLGRIDISNDDVVKVDISDEKLFADPPPKEDCPICLQPMPYSPGLCEVYTTYLPCCGKTSDGCCLAEDKEMEKGNIKQWCSCCRVPLPTTDEEQIKRFEKRMELHDAEAMSFLGGAYSDGDLGLPQDFNKTIDLWQKAAALGSTGAHYNLGIAYYHSKVGVEKDIEKAIQHWMLAAIGGHEVARFLLGMKEKMEANTEGNMNHAMKHFMIAARSGYEDSLTEVGEGYKIGYVTKDEYAAALRAHQDIRDEMKSKQRDIAAAALSRQLS